MHTTTNPLIAAVASLSGEMIALEPQSPPSSSSSEAERDAFEAWATRKFGQRPLTWLEAEGGPYSVPPESQGQYYVRTTQTAWEAWQARATPPSLPIDFKQASEQGGLTVAARDVHTIEGTVTFTRSDPATQECVCCPKGGGHIYGRRIKWDDYETNRPDHFGTSANVFVDSRVTDFNKNEGRRVRLTVELLPAAPSPHPEEGALLLGGNEGGKAMGGAS